MSTSVKLQAGSPFPAMSWPTVGGGTIDPQRMPGWRLLIVYRGKHCPLCKKYFKGLSTMLDDFRAANITVMAVSADPEAKARADAAEQDWPFPVGYGLSTAEMRLRGLYISEP